MDAIEGNTLIGSIPGTVYYNWMVLELVPGVNGNAIKFDGRGQFVALGNHGQVSNT